MRKIIMMLTAAAALTGLVSTAQAGDWSKDQTAVWGVVSQSWEDEVARNGKWPADYIHKDVVSWGAEWPKPRGAESMVKWSRFSEGRGKTLIYELFPGKVVVAGDTAVVTYHSVQVTENHEQKSERTVTGLIETLVRDGDSWKFLGLTSFQDSSDD
jgi:hypothetical protein